MTPFNSVAVERLVSDGGQSLKTGQTTNLLFTVVLNHALESISRFNVFFPESA
jgi:hypothetical protein